LLASAQLDLPALREGLLAWWAIHGRHSIPWKLGADQQPVACGEGLDPYPIWVAQLHENQQRLAASASTPG
jgi:adenine-specific DNA glycosylase